MLHLKIMNIKWILITASLSDYSWCCLPSVRSLWWLSLISEVTDYTRGSGPRSQRLATIYSFWLWILWRKNGALFLKSFQKILGCRKIISRTFFLHHRTLPLSDFLYVSLLLRIQIHFFFLISWLFASHRPFPSPLIHQGCYLNSLFILYSHLRLTLIWDAPPANLISLSHGFLVLPESIVYCNHLWCIRQQHYLLYLNILAKR